MTDQAKGFPVSRKVQAGFTLVEMLVVLAISAILTTLVVGSISGLSEAGSINQAASDLSGLFQQARTYAMANNTYVYVGLEELDGANPQPQAGTGRVVVVATATRDGTATMGTNDANLFAISKPRIFNFIHLANLSGNTSGNLERTTSSDSVDFLYTTAGAPSIPTSSSFSFSWPLGTASSSSLYQFNQSNGTVVQFNSRGMAQVVGSGGPENLAPWLEIGLQKAHGTLISNGPNVAVLQIEGITGAVKIYRP